MKVVLDISSELLKCGDVLAKNIAARREAMGWTKSELARRCAVSGATATNWEAGTTPRPRHLERLAREFRCTIADLYTAPPRVKRAA